MFLKKVLKDVLIVQVYVDDIVFGSTIMRLVEEFKNLMNSEFEMSLIGELNFFLGLQITQLKDGTRIHQQKYIREMLEKYGMNSSKSINTPISPNTRLYADEEGKSVDQKLYRGMIGSLLYLTASRPDIMFAVCLCARFQANPKESHMQEVKRIFRYLKGRDDLCLWYPRKSLIGVSSGSDDIKI